MMNLTPNACPNCQKDLAEAIASGADKCPACGQHINLNDPSPALGAARPFGRTNLLRLLLALDAVILFALGASFILSPKQVQLAFHFKDLPDGVNYMIGLWGCVLLTMAIGYGVAAANPFRHVVWVQVGIARGALECVLGAVYLARGIVTWQQAGFGLIIAAFITVAYLVLYPRKTQVIRMVANQQKQPPTMLRSPP